MVRERCILTTSAYIGHELPVNEYYKIWNDTGIYIVRGLRQSIRYGPSLLFEHHQKSLKQAKNQTWPILLISYYSCSILLELSWSLRPEVVDIIPKKLND